MKRISDHKQKFGEILIIPIAMFQTTMGDQRKEAEDKLAVVITIRPTDTEPFTNDLSMLLIERISDN